MLMFVLSLKVDYIHKYRTTRIFFRKSLRRFILPRANHSFLLECLNSTGLRDAAVTVLAEIALHPEIIR